MHRYDDQWWIGATVHGPHGDHSFGNWTWDHNGIEVKWFAIVILWKFSCGRQCTYLWICNQVWLDEERAERLARTELPHFPERPGGIFYHKDKDPKYKLYLKISTILWNLHSGYLWIWCLALEWLGLSTDSQVMSLIIITNSWWSLIKRS